MCPCLNVCHLMQMYCKHLYVLTRTTSRNFQYPVFILISSFVQARKCKLERCIIKHRHHAFYCSTTSNALRFRGATDITLGTVSDQESRKQLLKDGYKDQLRLNSCVHKEFLKSPCSESQRTPHISLVRKSFRVFKGTQSPSLLQKFLKYCISSIRSFSCHKLNKTEKIYFKFQIQLNLMSSCIRKAVFKQFYLASTAAM